MASFKEVGRVTHEIAPAGPAELARQSQFNAFAFGGEALGSGVTAAEIAEMIRKQGRLKELTPAQLATIERATIGGLARGFAPQLEAAANQITNILNQRGVRGSVAGQVFAGSAQPLAQALSQAQRQQAQMELNLPFMLQSAGLQQAGALQGLRGQESTFAQFSLQRDLAERQSNYTERQYKRKRGFWGSLGAALGGAALAGLTGGVGAAVAGGVGGLFGGGSDEAMPQLPAAESRFTFGGGAQPIQRPFTPTQPPISFTPLPQPQLQI